MQDSGKPPALDPKLIEDYKKKTSGSKPAPSSAPPALSQDVIDAYMTEKKKSTPSSSSAGSSQSQSQKPVAEKVPAPVAEKPAPNIPLPEGDDPVTKVIKSSDSRQTFSYMHPNSADPNNFAITVDQTATPMQDKANAATIAQFEKAKFIDKHVIPVVKNFAYNTEKAEWNKPTGVVEKREQGRTWHLWNMGQGWQRCWKHHRKRDRLK